MAVLFHAEVWDVQHIVCWSFSLFLTFISHIADRSGQRKMAGLRVLLRELC